MNAIEVGGKKIGFDQKPFIVAEFSANHGASLDQALKMVEVAAETGVDAVKLQTFTPDTMTLNLKSKAFVISNPESLWQGQSLYDLYEKAHMPWQWHKPLFDKCKALGVIGFSAPFDLTAVDFLEKLDVPMYKIASFENTDHALIQRVAQTKKPVIMSTGMATISELDESVQVARQAGCKDLILLKCTSSYPAKPSDINLLTIPHMRDLFQCQVGLSDHTLGLGVALASVSLNVTMIERHFTLSRSQDTLDAVFSSEPQEFKALVEQSRQAFLAMGQVHYGPTAQEEKSLQFRRSLYVTESMQVGDVFSEKNIRAIRPGNGLPPKYLKEFLGKKIMKDVEKGTPLQWSLIK